MADSRQLLLGLDVGTTATKALLFDLQGSVVASAVRPYPLLTPRPGWVEQDPEDLWRAVVYVTHGVLAQIKPTDTIIALSQASQGGTTIPVDAAGCPMYHAISWMDTRGIDEAARIRDLLGAETVRTTTGWPLATTLPLQHIAWLRANRPTVFAGAHRFLFVNDFITARLTHEHVMNPSDATMTQLFNISSGTWDEGLLAATAIRRENLSPVQPSGTPVARLNPEASADLGLPADVLVVNGAHDQYCAAVATGATGPGKMLLSGGTAWVLLVVPRDLQRGLDSGMAISCHAVPGRWGAIRSLGGVGTSFEWLITQIYSHGNEVNRASLYATVNAAAARVPPGANDLCFIPLAGGHTGNALDRGGFVDMTISHTRDTMARAVMEGIAFELRWAIEEIQGGSIAVDELTMVGGAAESPLWPQIVADVTGLPVVVPAERQAAARGAAILAGVGAGVFADAAAGFAAFRGAETRLEPQVPVTRIYNAAYAHYRARFAAVRETYS